VIKKLCFWSSSVLHIQYRLPAELAGKTG